MQKARRRAVREDLRPSGTLHASTVCRHTVSGTISLPLKGFFSPFPHGTGSLSVAGEYLALGGGPPGFTRDFTCPALLRNGIGPLELHVRGCHPLWPAFPVPFCSSLWSHDFRPATLRSK